MISKNVMGAIITVVMALVAALGCFVLRVMQRQSKGYAKTQHRRTFDDPEDDDAGAVLAVMPRLKSSLPDPPPTAPPCPVTDEDEDGHDAIAGVGASLTRR